MSRELVDQKKRGRKPGSESKVTKDFREQLKAKNFDVVEEIVKLMNDPEAKVADRCFLVKLVCEYSLHKPVAPVEPTPPPSIMAQNITMFANRSTASLEKDFFDHLVIEDGK